MRPYGCRITENGRYHTNNQTTCAKKLVEGFLWDIGSLEPNFYERRGVPAHILRVGYECSLPCDVKTDLQPWLTFDKPDIPPVEPSP